MRKYLAGLVLPCLLLAVGNASAAEKAVDPDEEYLRKAGIATDDAGLRKYLRECAEYDAKVRRIPALIRQLGAKDFREREKASAVLVGIGWAAFPALRKSTVGKDPEVSRRVNKCIQELFGKDDSSVLLTLDNETLALGLWDKFARELFSCGTREIALRLMLKRGKTDEVVPAFVDCLQAPDNQLLLLHNRLPELDRNLHLFHMARDLLEGSRRPRIYLSYASASINSQTWSLVELQGLRPKLRPIIESLYRAADAPNAERRALARQALNRLGREELVAARKDFHRAKNPQKRLEAVKRMGHWLFAKEEVPLLLVALNDGNNAVREAAAGKLGRMDLRAELVVPALIAALEDDAKDVRVTAAASLGGIGAESKTAIPALLRTLKKGDGALRWHSACSLGCIGPHDPAVVPALIEALDDPEARFGAMRGICAMGPAAKVAVAALVEIVRNPGPEKPFEPRLDAAVAALRAIAMIGPEAKEAVPALINLLNNDRTNEEIRDDVARTLGRIGPASSAAVPVLLKILKQNRRDYLCPNRILEIFGQIGPGARQAMPHIIAVGKDSQRPFEIRFLAAQVLEKIKPGSGAEIAKELKISPESLEKR